MTASPAATVRAAASAKVSMAVSVAVVTMVLTVALGPSPASAGEAARLFSEGRKLLESGSAADALLAQDLLARALDAYRRAGEAGGEAETLYALAVAAGFSGDLARARRLSLEALDVYQDLGDLRGEAAARDHVGGLLSGLGQISEAREHLETATRLRRSLGDPSALAASLHNLASLHLQAGEAGAALDLLGQALELHRELGEDTATASTLNNLGLLWLHLGRFDDGKRDLQEALALHRRQGDKKRLAGTLNNLGLVAWHQRRWQLARGHLASALDLRRELHDAAGIAETLGNLGLVDLKAGDFGAAAKRIDAAIRGARSSGQWHIEASHLATRGLLELRRGHLEQAVSTLRSAIEGLAEDPAARSVAWLHLAKALHRLGDPAGALRGAREATGLIETLRSSLEVGDLRAYFLASKRHFYDFEVDLLMRQGALEQALETSERARARGLLDLLRLAGDPALQRGLEESRALPDLAHIQGLLDRETLVIIYHLADPEDPGTGEMTAWAFTLDPEGLEGHDLGSSASIEAGARRAHERLSLSRLRAQRGPALVAAKDLSAAILEPLADRFRRRLVIVPDGSLHRIPFAALPGLDGQPLSESHEVVHLPSLSVLDQLRRRGGAREPPPAGELAIFADPVFGVGDPRLPAAAQPPTRPRLLDPAADGSFARLPFSGVEARRIAAFFPHRSTRLDVGLEATKEVLLGQELDFRRLHFATHARVDDRRPERSGLALSLVDADGRPRDGFVRLEDLFSLDLRATLVTLSACRSALGQHVRGEGLIGLSRGFFHAGAQQLVVSLWQVDDRATAELMEHFYGALAQGAAPAAALAKAQRHLRGDPRWSAPFYWAGFVVLGDWR